MTVAAPVSKQDLLSNAITALRGALPDLVGVLVTTTDGLPVAQSLNPGTDGNRVAAMAATALGLGHRINETLGSGKLTEYSVRCSVSQIYVYATGTKGALAVIAPTTSNLGLLHLESREAASYIAGIL